jgi:hypothetical protein
MADSLARWRHQLGQIVEANDALLRATSRLARGGVGA